MCFSPFGVIVAAVAAVVDAVAVVLVAPATVAALAAFVVALAVVTTTFLAVDVDYIFDCCVCRRLASSSPPPSPHHQGPHRGSIFDCCVPSPPEEDHRFSPSMPQTSCTVRRRQATAYSLTASDG